MFLPFLVLFLFLAVVVAVSASSLFAAVVASIFAASYASVVVLQTILGNLVAIVCAGPGLAWQLWVLRSIAVWIQLGPGLRKSPPC